MTPIRPKKYRKSRKGFLALLLIVLVVAGFGGYVYLIASGITSSSEMHASNNDYLILWEGNDHSYYYLIRANDGGRILSVRIPSTGFVEGSERPLQGNAPSSDYELMRRIFDLRSDHVFYWSMDERMLQALSGKLNIQASGIENFLESLAVRGLGFVDYWRLKDFVEVIEEHDPAASINRAGFAAFLKRVGEGRRTAFVIESMTEYPIRIRTSETSAPEPINLLRTESVNSFRQMIEEWQK